MIHPNVSELPGRLLLVVLALHGVVDHHLICTSYCQTRWKYKKLHVSPHNHSIWYPSWRKFNRSDTFYLSATSLVFSSRLSLPSRVSLTINTRDLNVIRHVGSIKNFHVNHHHHCISHPTWRNFQLKWYILMSATSQAFSSLLFLPSTVPSTTKPNEQKVGKWGIQEKGFYWTPKISSLVVCGLGTVEKNQICKTHRWLPLTILELAGRLSVRGP